MGSYGIGIERTMAAVVECCHDDTGIVWPVSVAPYEVVVSVLNPREGGTSDVGNAIYDALLAEGIDVLLDDRDERPGVKFNDADLIGIPFRLTVGPRGLKEGEVELARRGTRQPRNIDVHKSGATVTDIILDERGSPPRG